MPSRPPFWAVAACAGGEGMVPDALGTMVLPLLSNLCQFARVPSDVEYTSSGCSSAGHIADELLKRFKMRKGAG